MIAGDWNVEPVAWPELATLHPSSKPCAATNEDRTFAPTRWQGKRSLDWIWCNNPEWIQSLLFWESKVSDHKVVQFELQATERKAPHCILIPTRKWHKPTDVEIDVWIAALKDAWGPTKTFPLTGDADADWKLFCSKAENMHLEALRTGGQLANDRGSFRAKSSVPKITRHKCHTVRAKQLLPFRERNLLGHAMEARRQEQAGREADAQHLLRKLHTNQVTNLKDLDAQTMCECSFFFGAAGRNTKLKTAP